MWCYDDVMTSRLYAHLTDEELDALIDPFGDDRPPQICSCGEETTESGRCYSCSPVGGDDGWA